uniref:AIG1-type G domain-containing protein n=1 Tax=Monopterus albus TaxID=43700 RepID=A0A3Q3KG93_MONAL
MPVPEVLRIVLLGRYGAGKTASKNTILNKEERPEHTKECMEARGKIDQQEVVIVDTPGLFKSDKNDDVVREIQKSISLAKPGPHVFLFVVNPTDKFTKEQEDTVNIICRKFGRNTPFFTMVLFTFGPHENIENYINSNKVLRDFIMQCNWRYHVFDNNNKDPKQVTDLLQKINNMTERKGESYYTNKMLIDAKTEQEQQQTPKQTPEEKSEKFSQIRNSGLLGTGAGCLLGYLVGGGEMTSTLAAAMGGLAGGILGSTSAGLTIFLTDHIKNVCGK